MQTELKIKEIIIDNADTILKELQKGTDFQLIIFDNSDEEKSVGMWLEHTDNKKDCTIMFELTPKEALFFGKSLIALAKSI